MVIILLLLCFINVVVCERCPPGKYGENCEHICRYLHCVCNSLFDCESCEAGYWNTSRNCTVTCISPKCACTNYTNCLSCKDGYYGLESRCNNVCSSRCDGNKCDNNGYCDTNCTDGRYGANCSLQCSRGCVGNVCSAIDGSCSCSRYFSGDRCEYCIAGQYGFNCEKTCSSGCLKHTCSSADGKCECKDYYKGDTCDDCVKGRNGDHCLNSDQQTQPSDTDNNLIRALALGVIGVDVVLVAGFAVSILARRILAQRAAQGHTDEQGATTPEREAVQPGPYETLNTTRTETNDRRDTYTRLFTTGLTGMTENVNSDNITMNHLNIEVGKVAQSGPYETLNATHLKENDRNDKYTMLSMIEHAGASGSGNSEIIPMDEPKIYEYIK